MSDQEHRGFGTAKIWNPTTGREILTLRGGHVEGLRSLAWSPDSSKLATSGGDGTAKIWDANTGAELLTFRGHKPSVVAELDPEFGKILRSTGAYAARTNVNSVAWSPDGKYLASAGDDSIVQIYAIHEVELLHLVRSRITRDLTANECKLYLNLAQCPAMPNLPESSLSRPKSSYWSSKIKNFYVTVFGAGAMIGVTVLLLRLCKSILEPDQKRLFSKGADALLSHLSRLHPVRSLRFLKTRRGRWILPFISALEISALVPHALHSFLLAMAVLTVLYYTPPLSKLSGHILAYCLNPLEPRFEGSQGRSRAMVAGAIAKITTLGGACFFVISKSLHLLQFVIAKHGELYGLIVSVLVFVLLSYLTLFTLLLLTFGLTFVGELR
jgi:hypothetical protein